VASVLTFSECAVSPSAFSGFNEPSATGLAMVIGVETRTKCHGNASRFSDADLDQAELLREAFFSSG
jgi:hypothetical protein